MCAVCWSGAQLIPVAGVAARAWYAGRLTRRGAMAPEAGVAADVPAEGDLRLQHANIDGIATATVPQEAGAIAAGSAEDAAAHRIEGEAVAGPPPLERVLADA